MKRLYPYLKNKYVVTTIIFVLYMLFFDNLDVFSIVNQVQKKNALEKAQTEILLKLEDTEKTLKELKTLAGKERFAREKKFFKRDNEEIFVISYE